MEFDSLAFSATRLTPKKEERVYCPACHEVCEPEPASAASEPPTCPVCSEKCVVQPPFSVVAERQVWGKCSVYDDGSGFCASPRKGVCCVTPVWCVCARARAQPLCAALLRSIEDAHHIIKPGVCGEKCALRHTLEVSSADSSLVHIIRVIIRSLSTLSTSDLASNTSNVYSKRSTVQQYFLIYISFFFSNEANTAVPTCMHMTAAPVGA